jgi:hypothetical protein
LINAGFSLFTKKRSRIPMKGEKRSNESIVNSQWLIVIRS